MFLTQITTTSEEICARMRGNASAWEKENESLTLSTDQWPVVTFPSVLIGIWLAMVGTGFFILAFIAKIDLPNYHCPQMVSTVESDPSSEKNCRFRKYLLLSLGLVLYLLTCGVDSYFQSQTYTFGLCGPMAMSAKDAGWLNSVYFLLYLVGRIISIPLSTWITPAGIIVNSLIGCLTASIILVTIGTTDSIALFVATAIMGFCVCFQFGSGITWLSGKIPDMTSRQISMVFLGSNLANCLFPPLASKLFNDFGPIWVFYLTLATLILALICFALMTLVSIFLHKPTQRE